MIIEDQVMLPVKPADSSDVVTIIYINIINSAVNLMVKQVRFLLIAAESSC